MNSEETVGKYLTRAKIKDATSWNSDIDEADTYHIFLYVALLQLLKAKLKSRMLRRVSQFKTYKELFNNIEDKWEQSYFMEDNFTGKEDTPSVAAEVDKIYAWNETTTDNPMEAEILSEVNEVYHKYLRYPTQCEYWTPRPRPQNFRAPFRGGQRNQRPFSPSTTTPGTWTPQ